MRILGSLCLMAICLALAGCSSSGKKSAGGPTPVGGPGAGAQERPPLVPSSPSTQTTIPARTSGIIAGQVVDAFGRARPNTYILVVKTEDAARPAAERKSAPIQPDVEANNEGYFLIPDLEPGKQYELRARAPEGDHLLAGTYVATPPNARVLIRISEDFATPSTPPIPPRPTWPTPGPGNANPEGRSPSPIPSQPASPRNDLPPPGVNLGPPRTGSATGGGLPPNVVQERQDWPPKVLIRGPKDKPLDGGIPPGPPPGPDGFRSPSPELPPLSAAGPQVPACKFVNRRLEELVLKDIDGKVWDYKRDRTGKVLLIDIWYSSCDPCRRAIPELKDLQKRYESSGLQVIGIAAQPPGSLEEQVGAVRAVGRLPQINGFTYPILMTDQASSPVTREFNVQGFPTIVLVDQSGQVVYYRTGLDPQLESEIRRRLSAK